MTIRYAALVALVLFGWATIMLALPFVGSAGRQVALVGNQSRIVSAVLAAGGSIVDYRGGTIIARSPNRHFAAALYRAGVPLVLESRLAAGCLGRRRAG